MFGVPMTPTTPRFLKRIYFAIGDMFVIDRCLARPINAMRRDLGLRPVRGIFRKWMHSPDLCIGLFPDWFALPQRDWPPNSRVTGFPLYDERGLEPLSAELLSFLDAGSPPIAFTPGSAMRQGLPFFQAAAEACKKLGRRGLLLSRHRGHIPADLTPGVIHIDYAPFSELLPRCAALVHHGGVGTLSQALASGIPQLVMPMAHDQIDNASRLCRLGVAAQLEPKLFRGPAVADALGALLGSDAVAAKCREIAERFSAADPLGQTCDLIESLAPARSAASRTWVAASPVS